jgi:rhodanese-related sulfurtransferase
MLEFWLDPESVYFKDDKLDMNKEMIVFCAGGLRSALAAKSLKEMGYDKVSHIDGGFGLTKHKGFKIV